MPAKIDTDEEPNAVEVKANGVLVPAPKKRGRPPGAKNKPKPAKQPVAVAATESVPVAGPSSVTSVPSVEPPPPTPVPAAGPQQAIPAPIAPKLPKAPIAKPVPSKATQDATVTPASQSLAVRRRG